eukprot:GEZU01029271.1.p1 GENE.GEZU01029271.1~~GEZU01029271.1.p1  ORF type:complete len:440 (+),score=207.97 GEZU01029271.1:175-1320(+)
MGANRKNKGGNNPKFVEEVESDEEQEQEVSFAQIQQQLGKMMTSPDDFTNSLPTAVQNRVKVVQKLQSELKSLRQKYYQEVKALEQKYEQLYAPLYQKRAGLVAGDIEPTEEELAEIVKIVEIKEEGEKKGEEEEPESKGIPDFWLRALQNHELLDDAIQERDEDALKYLKDITSETFSGEQGQGFLLKFHFAPNPYFNNEVLTKTYYLIEEDDLMLDRAEGTPIEWKDGKNLTVQTVKKKQRHKGGRNVRTVTKTEPCDSFFNFFAPPKLDENEDAEDEEMEANIEDLMEADFEMGQAIKTQIIPNAVDYYIGAVQFAGFPPGMEFGFGDEDDEDENDDEGRFEEVEDDEDEEEKPKKGDKKQGGAGAAAPAENPECKQQ